jgi:hypothetical protein
MTAAAGGGYLATRQNTVPTPAAAQTAPIAATPAASTPASATSAAPTPDRPVQETEAVVGDAVKPAAPAAADTKTTPRRAQPAARPAPSRTIAQTGSSRDQTPTLTSTWPSSAQQQPAAQPAPVSTPEPLPARVDDRSAQEPIRTPEPPKPAFEELVISRDSVIGLQTEGRISSETARVEDRVEARVTRDVKVGDHVAVPSGARVIGSVTQVERGGKYREQAKLGIRFHTIVLADGTRLPITTETILRLGEAPGNSSAAKIGGGAVGGAILGAILGGAKGAAIGATAGAGAGTAAVQAGDRSAAVLQPGTPLTARILSPVTVTVEKDQQ